MSLTSYSYEAAIILFCTVSGFNKKIYWQNLRCEIMTMGKTSKVVVCGTKKCGKTSILEQAINGKLGVSITSNSQFGLLDKDSLASVAILLSYTVHLHFLAFLCNTRRHIRS